MTTDTVQQPTSEFVQATMKYLADDKDPVGLHRLARRG